MAWIVVWWKKADRKFTGDLELLKEMAWVVVWSLFFFSERMEILVCFLDRGGYWLPIIDAEVEGGVLFCMWSE